MGRTALDRAKSYRLEEIISLLSNEERIKELIQLKNEIDNIRRWKKQE